MEPGSRPLVHIPHSQSYPYATQWLETYYKSLHKIDHAKLKKFYYHVPIYSKTLSPTVASEYKWGRTVDHPPSKIKVFCSRISHDGGK